MCAFQNSRSLVPLKTPLTTLYEQDEGIGTAASTETSVNGSGDPSALMRAEDAKSQLFSAFANLDLSDQYDAVLTGLCAKILDNKALSEDDCKVAIRDPIQLMEEMNGKNIPASPRSLMALIDATIRTQDAKSMASVLSLCIRNPRGIRQFGAEQSSILQLPSTPTTKVRCPDGSMKTRTERLDNAAKIPVDEREKEVAYALAFGGLVAFTGLVNLFGMDDITLYTNTLLLLTVSVGLVDNFYDLLRTGSSMVAGQIQKDEKDKNKKFNLPEKDSLPLGLGTGKLTGSTIRGLARLLTVDAEREAECEAAAFFAAYSLGLPCFAFQPNAFEGSVLTVESMQDDNDLSPLLSSSGILRMLVWLMAPVAMESSKHSQLIMSDPREAAGFLARLEEVASNDPSMTNELWFTNDVKERKDLLQWAFTEADLLLRDNRKSVKEISDRLTGGAATIADCVAAVEGW